jgi:hypothetical protein
MNILLVKMTLYRDKPAIFPEPKDISPSDGNQTMARHLLPQMTARSVIHSGRSM